MGYMAVKEFRQLVILIQYRSVADRDTDRQTDERTELLRQYRALHSSTNADARQNRMISLIKWWKNIDDTFSHFDTIPHSDVSYGITRSTRINKKAQLSLTTRAMLANSTV